MKSPEELRRTRPELSQDQVALLRELSLVCFGLIDAGKVVTVPTAKLRQDFVDYVNSAYYADVPVLVTRRDKPAVFMLGLRGQFELFYEAFKEPLKERSMRIAPARGNVAEVLLSVSYSGFPVLLSRRNKPMVALISANVETAGRP